MLPFDIVSSNLLSDSKGQNTATPINFYFEVFGYVLPFDIISSNKCYLFQKDREYCEIFFLIMFLPFNIISSNKYFPIQKDRIL